jgi:hypothetical protein
MENEAFNVVLQEDSVTNRLLYQRMSDRTRLTSSCLKELESDDSN